MKPWHRPLPIAELFVQLGRGAGTIPLITLGCMVLQGHLLPTSVQFRAFPSCISHFPQSWCAGPCCRNCAISPSLPSLLLRGQQRQLRMETLSSKGRCFCSPRGEGLLPVPASCRAACRAAAARRAHPRPAGGTGDSRHALPPSCCSCGESADFGSCKQGET